MKLHQEVREDPQEQMEDSISESDLDETMKKDLQETEEVEVEGAEGMGSLVKPLEFLYITVAQPETAMNLQSAKITALGKSLAEKSAELAGCTAAVKELKLKDPRLEQAADAAVQKELAAKLSLLERTQKTHEANFATLVEKVLRKHVHEHVNGFHEPHEEAPGQRRVVEITNFQEPGPAQLSFPNVAVKSEAGHRPHHL